MVGAEHLEAFVVAATDGRREVAEAILAEDSEIARDPWGRLVLGHGWEGDATAPGGPRGWAPLLYATHSCFASEALVRELLARGADPDTTYVNELGAQSALYGAAGVNHDPAVTRILLDAGADPDDGESVYHSVESPDTACLTLLLAHGAEPNGTNALAHALDSDHVEHVRLLLDAGADPGESAVVAHAVRRGASVAAVRLLAARGADVDRPGGETWRGDVPLRTPYAHAALRDREDLTTALAELGADTTLAPADRAVAALARGERPSAPLPEPLDPDAQEVLVLAALRGELDAVVDALGPDFRGVVGRSPDMPLLHHAAWVGDPRLVGRLLERGADPAALTRAPFATALAVTALASQYHALPGRDYVAVAGRLLDAGADGPGARELEVAQGPLRGWLRASESG